MSYLLKSAQSIEKVSDDTTRDYWMTADEALEYGLVSKIVTSIDEVHV